MTSYWKVRTPCEKLYPDLKALYGHARYFATASEAEARCQELNEAHDQKLDLRGTFSFAERFVRGGVYEDGDEAKKALEG